MSIRNQIEFMSAECAGFCSETINTNDCPLVITYKGSDFTDEGRTSFFERNQSAREAKWQSRRSRRVRPIARSPAGTTRVGIAAVMIEELVKQTSQ
jgi:hypothetical protein